MLVQFALYNSCTWDFVQCSSSAQSINCIRHDCFFILFSLLIFYIFCFFSAHRLEDERIDPKERRHGGSKKGSVIEITAIGIASFHSWQSCPKWEPAEIHHGIARPILQCKYIQYRITGNRFVRFRYDLESRDQTNKLVLHIFWFLYNHNVCTYTQ